RLLEVRDDAVLQWTDRDDIGRRAAEHSLRLFPDCNDLPVVLVNRNHARLANDDPSAADVNEGVGGPQVDSNVARKPVLKSREEAAAAHFGRTSEGETGRAVIRSRGSG